jgi:hypothetical protein
MHFSNFSLDPLLLSQRAFLIFSQIPSVTGIFIPLWQRGIKGDFKIMLRKSPLAPLCLSMTGKGSPKRGIRVHLYCLHSQLRDYFLSNFSLDKPTIVAVD